MWKVVAVFLLLLVLVAISALNKVGLNWMLTVFFSLLGVGIFIYVTASANRMRGNTKEINDIKSAIGETSYKSKMGTDNNAKPEIKPIEIPKIIEPESHLDVAETNEIHVPAIETPKLDLANPVAKTDTEKPIQTDAKVTSKAIDPEMDEKPISIDLAALRAKIKKDDEDGK